MKSDRRDFVRTIAQGANPSWNDHPRWAFHGLIGVLIYGYLLYGPQDRVRGGSVMRHAQAISRNAGHFLFQFHSA